VRAALRRGSVPASLLLVSFAHGAAAHADSVSEELTVGSTVAAAGNPATQWLADRLACAWSPADDWELALDLSASRARSTTISANASDAIVTSMSLSYAPDEHWSISITGGWSPRVNKSSLARIEADDLPTGVAEADVVLVASSRMTSVSLSASYDTASEGDLSTLISASARASFFTTDQAITSVSDPDGQMFTIDEMREHCATHDCSDPLWDGLWPLRDEVRQLVIGAGVGETVYQDTDMNLDAEYFVYDRDPTQAGFFAVATVDGGNLGDGVAVAPQRYAVSPSIAHRFGTASATASASYGRYIYDDLGHEVTASLRVQVKLHLDDDRRLKLYGKLTSSWDVPPEARTSQSVSLAVGGEYAW
jgi:hypothetical protein